MNFCWADAAAEPSKAFSKPMGFSSFVSEYPCFVIFNVKSWALIASTPVPPLLLGWMPQFRDRTFFLVAMLVSKDILTILSTAGCICAANISSHSSMILSILGLISSIALSIHEGWADSAGRGAMMKEWVQECAIIFKNFTCMHLEQNAADEYENEDGEDGRSMIDVAKMHGRSMRRRWR